MIGFDDLFTSYNASGREHARGVYLLTSYYHTPKKQNFETPFVVKIGMSMNFYNRMSNYDLYYPEGFWALAFIFLPLKASFEDVKIMEKAIHNFPTIKKLQYKNEWFKVPSIDYALDQIEIVLKDFPEAQLFSDLSKRITLSSKYIPMRLKDLKIIEKIEKEQKEDQKRQMKLKEAKEKEIKKGVVNKSDKGPSYNTRFYNIKYQ